MNKGLLNNYSDDKYSVLMHGDGMNKNDVAVLEGELRFSGDNEIRIGNVDEPVIKCDSMLHSEEFVRVEKVDESMEKGDHVLHPHEPASPKRMEVSGDRINLSVDVFGPLNRNKKSNILDGPGEHKSGESGNEYSLEENGTIFPGVKDVSGKNEGEDIVGERECPFGSGDLVWVKTRTQSWWPGMISGLPKAAYDTTNTEKSVSFLVKYYGSASSVWCDLSDLKPFIEYFEQMSGQNNSRNFCGSVDRALCEIGQRVKSKMTCPCFKKESQTLEAQCSMGNKEENSMMAAKDNKLDVISLAQIEPASFVTSIKDLARSIHVPGKVELTIMKNCLSPFYCSIGHRELPLQLLRSEAINEDQCNVSGDGKRSVQVHNGIATRAGRTKKNRSEDGDLVFGANIVPSGKDLELRERKKSRFLSYPYVDAKQEDSKHPSSLSTTSTPQSSRSGGNSRKKGAKTPLKGRCIVSKVDDVDACSSELLAELCCLGRDCFYLGRSQYSDSLKRFYESFRVFAFLDADIASKDARDHKEGIKVVKGPKQQKVNLASGKERVESAVDSKPPGTDNPKVNENVKKRTKKRKERITATEKQMERVSVGKELENLKGNHASVEESVGDKFAKLDNAQVKDSVVCGKDKKRKEQVTSTGLGSILNSFSMGINIFPNSSGMIRFQSCSNMPKSGTTFKKSEGVIPGLGNICPVSRLPDLNGSHPSVSFEHIPVGEPSMNLAKSLPEQTKGAFMSSNMNGVNHVFSTPISSHTDVSATPQTTPQLSNSVNVPNRFWNHDFTAGESGSNVMNVGHGQFTNYALKMGIFGSAGNPKPRKRKRKEKTDQFVSAIPDLNGNVLDVSSAGNIMPEGNRITPEGEPPKRRRSKFDLGPNGESLGGSLLLNFTPGSTLPSKEMLVATFSRFGLLKESELQVLSETSIQIAYERRSDARFAFRSMEKGHTFGESLVSFTTDCMPPPSKILIKNNVQKSLTTDGRPPPLKILIKNDVQKLRTFAPVDTSKNPTMPREAPDIAVIKQKVEMMKMTLEKAGDGISAEMRAKLENEIKAFLDKISSMQGSSSS